MKTKMILMATIPALMLAVAGYAEDPGASAATKADAKGAIEVSAITKTAKVTAVPSATLLLNLSFTLTEGRTETVVFTFALWLTG